MAVAVAVAVAVTVATVCTPLLPLYLVTVLVTAYGRFRGCPLV